jgi:hypothetical protein
MAYPKAKEETQVEKGISDKRRRRPPGYENWPGGYILFQNP